MGGAYLGLDIGTSGVKALLIGEDGAHLAEAHAGLDISRPQPGWSEQDPDAWIAATKSAIAGLPREALAKVRGIGLSGQMHGATLLDAGDRPLRPAILWNDGRSAADCAVLEGRADFRGIGGNIVMAGFTAPKLEWVRTHEPEIFARVAKVLLPKDYVRLWLTGEHVSDMSDSAGTLWLDVAGRRWSPALLAATGLSEAQMPALVEGSAPGGVLLADLAAEWGTGAVTVAGGGGDNAASGCGMGVVAPGSAFLSLGTSGVLFASNARFSPNAAGAVHAFCHAVPDTWHQMGVMLSATDSLNWLGRITGREPAALAGAVAAGGPGAVTFLPYLSGERTPHNDPGARGLFAGLSAATGVEDMARAVMEGVAFNCRDNLDALAAAGTEIEAAWAIGGGARSPVWLQMIADATGLTLLTPAKGDYGAAFGAARLGLCAAEEAVPAEVMTHPEIEAETAPGDRAAWEEALERWRRLYRNTREDLR